MESMDLSLFTLQYMVDLASMARSFAPYLDLVGFKERRICLAAICGSLSIAAVALGCLPDDLEVRQRLAVQLLLAVLPPMADVPQTTLSPIAASLQQDIIKQGSQMALALHHRRLRTAPGLKGI